MLFGYWRSYSDDNWQARNPTVNNRRLCRNPVIETEASVDNDADVGKDYDDGAKLIKCIVDNNIY